MEDKVETLNISVGETINTQEIFGRIQDAMKRAGIGGTLHLTSEAQKQNMVDIAWALAIKTGLPVVIVVRPIK